MKRLISAFLSVVMTACMVSLVPAFDKTVYAETEGNYTYTVSNGEASITDCNTSVSGDITIPSTLGGYPVTSIGERAFSNCQSLTSVAIPNSVTSIGNWAFEYCYSLNSIIIPSKVTSIGEFVFRLCYSLTSVTIPNSVISIGNWAFCGCSNLNSVTISDSVTSIGDYTFYDCGSLTSVTIPDCVTSIGDSAFEECISLASITIPNSVTSIGNGAFDSCSSLTSITIPDSVISIGEGVFCDCGSLISVAIPNSVTSIGDGVFKYCGNLTSVTIPNSVTSIGDWAFCGCSSLTSLTISDSVTSIGAFAFYDCGRLTSVAIPNSVTSIGNDAFDSCISLTSITIPDSVTSIGDFAFARCSSITSINIPSGVTSIGDYAFVSCGSLMEINVDYDNIYYSSQNGALFNISQIELIAYPAGKSGEYTIPSSVTRIQEYAFYECDSLTSVTIPSSVVSIGDFAFYGCDSLISINADINNNYYSSQDGILYNKKKTMLIVCPGGKGGECAIPSSVTGIEYYAFCNCRSLTSVTIPNSVISIGEDAFRSCCNDLTIYCSAGSYAENYAESHEINCASFSGFLFAINGVSVSDGITVNTVNYYGTIENLPMLLIAIYDGQDTLLETKIERMEANTDIYHVNTDLPSNIVKVRVFMWDNLSGNMIPVAAPGEYKVI